MDSKLLLVKIITLLYFESQLSDNNDNSSALAKQVINSIRLPEVSLDTDRGREVIVALRATASWMADNPADYTYDKTELLQRIRVNVGDDEALYKAFVDGMEDKEDEESIKQTCLQYRQVLRNHLARGEIKQVVKDASQQVLFNEESVDWKNFVPELITKLEPYNHTLENGKQDGVVDDVMFDDTENVERILNEAKQESGSDGCISTPWQALNRMMGDHEGFKRGEVAVVGGLQHDFKSGFVLSLFKAAGLYNTPQMWNENKKPLIMLISFENELKTNIMWLYKNLVENETGEACDVQGVDENQAAQYIRTKLGQNGYYISMCRIDPSEYTYHDLIDRLTYFETMGYEIHFLVLDYLNMMSKRGCAQGAQGQDVRDLFRRVRNYVAPRGITTVTPHQLSTEAKALVRMGVDNFVQEVANKGYWDSCKTIDQEVDLELIIHKEMVNDESYLAIQRGKHRKVTLTPPKHWYTVLKFEPVATIPDDINGKDLSRKYIGGAAVADGGHKPWYAD